MIELITKDQIWKEIIEELFPRFIEFFLPELYKDIDFSKKVTFLEQELNKLFPRSKEHGRRVDKLAEVTLKNKRKKLVLVHVEVQGYYDKHFDKRIFSYYYRIYDRFKKDIVTLAIFTEDNKNYKPDKFQKKNYGTEITFKYNIYKILEQSGKELLKSKNIFSLVILASLYSMQSQNDDEKKLNFKIELAKLLFKKNYPEEYLPKLLKFIDVLLFISDEMKDKLFYEKVRKMATTKEEKEIVGNFERYVIKKAEHNKELEIAKKAKKEGLQIELIMKLTGLTREEIEKI